MPVPLQQSISGQTDANGNATYSQVIRAAYWCGVYVTAQGQGSPTWAVGPNGTSEKFGQSANAVMGPVLLPPGSQLSLEEIGGTPNSGWSANLWGWQSQVPDGSDLAGLFPSVETIAGISGIGGPVTIGGNVPVVNAPGTNLKTTQNQSQLGTFGAIPSGTSPSQNFTIDPGAHALALLFQNIPAGAGQVVVAGVQSNSIYTTEQLADIGPGDTWVSPVFPGGDTQVNVQIQNNTGVTITGVTVVEILDVESPFIFPGPKLVKQGTPSTIAQSTNWGVTQQKASPAPWQRAGQGGVFPPVFNATIAANSDGPTLDAGTAGQSIFLHTLNAVAQALAATLPALWDTANNPFWESNASNAIGLGAPVEFNGQPVNQGNGVKLRNNGGVAMTITGCLVYSKVAT